ncbi:MAG TPA: M23 family metallopeptidase [Rectinemataceae bacterium]|nr:M23 family metallopeptidase [Rectinemataceae bacterium]
MISLKRTRSLRLTILIAIPCLALGCVLLMKPSASDVADGLSLKTVGSGPTNSLKDAEIASSLSPSNIGDLEPDYIKKLGSLLVTRAVDKRRNPADAASSVFPTTSETLAMLARDRDVDDYLENASEKGPAGAYYQAVVDLVPSFKPLRGGYEALFESAYKTLIEAGKAKVPTQAYADAALYESGVTLPGLSSKPRESDYDYSHTFALDIFLKDVELLPFSTLQKGPAIFSFTDAIVIATDSSWRGGEDLTTYRSGGITPKAGNGVILYSPQKQKYYLFFHLFDVLVKPGEAIPKGYPIGHGGNTGTNARKKGHGEHLHLEIYDVASSRFLRNYEIADIVF